MIEGINIFVKLRLELFSVGILGGFYRYIFSIIYGKMWFFWLVVICLF